MVKSRFLGKPPKTRCRRRMVRVGVSDFVDNQAKNARLISIALDSFRNRFKNDEEEFRGFTDEVIKNTVLKDANKLCNQKITPCNEQNNHDSVMIYHNTMDYPQIQHKTNPINLKSNKNTFSKTVDPCLDDNLNYTYANSCKGGPFNINENSGEVQCGICGIVRFYKSIIKTKKYGAYTCDSCRKFLSKSIENKNTINRCNNERGIGQCRIPTGFKSQNGVTRIVSIDSRCKACWLQMCLKRLKLPEPIVERLLHTLPKEMLPVLKLILKKPNPWGINVGSYLQKKIIRECKLDQEIISPIRDNDSDESNNESYSSKNNIDEYSDKTDSDVEYTLKKKCIRKKSKFKDKLNNSKMAKRKINKLEMCKDFQSNDFRQVTSLQPISTEIYNSVEITESKIFNKIGPRIKHVCHSAEFVLGQIPAICENENKTEVVRDNKILSMNTLRSAKTDENLSSAMEVTNDINSKISIPINEQDFYLTIQPIRTLQDLMKQDHLNANINNFEDNKTIDLNFHESYDPDRIAENGFAIVGTVPLSIPQQAVCYLCGSAGMEKLIHCVSCCEPYHKFCVYGVDIGVPTHKSEWSKIIWTCPKCKICKGCQSRGQTRPKLTCQRCKDSYHDHCLDDKIIYDRNRPWACPTCRKCKSCCVPRVDYFVGNLALCAVCFQLRQRGNYCPLCQKCYEPDDYETKMMECATCKHWVHAKCEGLSNEKYEVLSTLPEVVEYVCKNCTINTTVPWRIYVDEELKNGFRTILIILGKNKKTSDLIKWSPQKQSPGCVCKKLNIPKFPSLDDGPNVIFKTTNEIPKQCVCHGLEGWSKGTPTLVTIKQKVNNNEYDSLCQFNNDMLNTIDKFNVPDLREEYKKIVTKVFPWFDSDFEKNSFSISDRSSTPLPIISPPKFIPKISYNVINSDNDIISNDENNYYLTPIINDTRICQFCKKLGEGMPMREGRLLYCGDNIWTHANCALWSSEVFEEIDGSLQNVQLALSRGKLVRCIVCNEKGASVGCCYRNCVKTYHFQCARKVFCIFNENKTVYCNNHASDTRCSVKDFTLERLIYIEQEDIKRDFPINSDIYILIGSLYISSIGHLHPLLSDSVRSILPVDFKAKRYYWSTKNPWKLIQYNWTTKLENYVEKLECDEINYTIDHNKQENEFDDFEEVDCEPNLDINLVTSIQVENVKKCLKRDCPKDTTFASKRCKKDSTNYFTHAISNSDYEFESTIDETCRMELFSNSYGLKSKEIPQFDGLYDSSDCESEFELYHLDNLTDVIDNCSSEQPVKCNRCHRTYRTSVSYERHLVHCNFDYEISSDSESSDDDRSDKKIEDHVLPIKEKQILQVEPLKEDHIMPQLDYNPVAPIQSVHQQQSSSTVIIQPVQTPFVQPSMPEVQYITINNPTQPVMPCFQYQTSPTVLIHPPVVDPTTVVLNNSSMDMYVSQSNNLLFNSPPMMVGLDQYTMSSNYTFTQASQIYQPTKSVEPISNQYYIINSEPITVSNEWSYNITSEIKTDHKIVSTQPKVYINRKLRQTENYNTKENIPNSLVQSVESQVNGVMNNIKNVNPEPWKRQTLKKYPPKKMEEQKISSKKIEEKKILPKCNKCIEIPKPKISNAVNIVENNTSSFTNTMTSPSKNVENILSPNKLKSSSRSIASNNLSPTFKLKDMLPSYFIEEYKNSKSAIASLRALLFAKISEENDSSNCSLNIENDNLSDKEKITLSTDIQQLDDTSSPQSLSKCISFNLEKTSPTLELEKQSAFIQKVEKIDTCQVASVVDMNASSSKIEKSPNIILDFDKSLKNSKSIEVNKLLIDNDKLSTINPLSNNSEYFSTNIHNINEKKIDSNIELTSIQEKSSQVKTTTEYKNCSDRQWSNATAEHAHTVPHLMFEMSSTDGVFCKDRSLVEIWSKLFEAIQLSRNECKMPQLSTSNPYASGLTAAIRSLGLSNNFLKYLLEQLSGAKEFVKYKPIYHKGVDIIGSTTESSGCARTGIVVRKNKYDMFSWLASRHRKPPKLLENSEDFGGRRANSLPNEMKYRNMNKALTRTVGVYRSDIHGRGLFCLRDIEQGEYIIEYTGETIRSEVSDVRERLYNKKAIDCYMFRIDHNTVVDATMSGNSSRFINHSCEPNCHSKIEIIHGNKHIMILAKRKLLQGEELTYDYKFPLEDDKITCHCLSRKCRKYLN